MAIDPTCIHGLVVRWCSLCRAAKRAARGKCPICNQDFKSGDVMTNIMPSGEAVHEYCL
jgi:hypothetical protein